MGGLFGWYSRFFGEEGVVFLVECYGFVVWIDKGFFIVGEDVVKVNVKCFNFGFIWIVFGNVFEVVLVCFCEGLVIVLYY